MEVTGHVNGVVNDHVELLSAHHDARYAAQKSKANQGDKHARKNRIAPRRFAQPFKQAIVVAFSALCDFDRARNSEAVNHGGQHSEIHEVAGVDDLPGGAYAGVG